MTVRVGARVSAGVRVRAAEADEGRGDVVVRVEVRAELYEEELRGGEDVTVSVRVRVRVRVSVRVRVRVKVRLW